MVADTTGDSLLVYDTSGRGTLLHTLPAPSRPYGLAYDSTRRQLWVTLTGANRIARYDAGPDGLRESGTWPTVQDAYSVAIDEPSGTVVIVGEKQAQLQFLTP